MEDFLQRSRPLVTPEVAGTPWSSWCGQTPPTSPSDTG